MNAVSLSGKSFWLEILPPKWFSPINTKVEDIYFIIGSQMIKIPVVHLNHYGMMQRTLRLASRRMNVNQQPGRASSGGFSPLRLLNNHHFIF